MRRALSILAAVAVCAPASALAATYQVGPGKPYASLSELAYLLEPGDLVEVDGNASYAGDIHIRPDSSGSAAQKVTIRGITIDGKRPVIHGGAQWGIVLHGSHTVFENFDVTAASGACIINKAHDVTIRNVLVHDCPGIGIMGTDSESGDLTIEHSEVYNCGDGLYDHQIYVASDETMYPGSTFRLQHSYIHDANGGNNVKSRAERNEIYGNWIEAPGFHCLDLIGPDGQDPSLAREDSDVVGNVLIQTGEYQIARIGGDGTGATGGRYRFAYNTIVASSTQSILFRLADEVESVAIHDNVFLLPNGGAPTFFDDDEAIWMTGAPQVAGERNFVQQGLQPPSFFSASLAGADPMVENLSAGNFVPVLGSPLIDSAIPATGPSGYEVPNALGVPTFVPPPRTVSSSPLVRPLDGASDVGAYELGSGEPSGTGGGGNATGGGGGDVGGGEGGDAGLGAAGGGDSQAAGGEARDPERAERGGRSANGLASCAHAPTASRGPALLGFAAVLVLLGLFMRKVFPARSPSRIPRSSTTRQP